MANTLHSSVKEFSWLLLMECMCLWTQPTSQCGGLVHGSYPALWQWGLLLAGTILILVTEMLPSLLLITWSHVPAVAESLSTASSHVALRLSLKQQQQQQQQQNSIYVTQTQQHLAIATVPRGQQPQALHNPLYICRMVVLSPIPPSESLQGSSGTSLFQYRSHIKCSDYTIGGCHV